MKFKKTLSLALVLSLATSTMILGNTENDYIPGTYESSAQGFGGSVTVKVTVDENSITNVVVDGKSETENIGSKAIEELPAKITEANSTNIDGVSGATYTSEAILKATESALELAKGTEVAEKIVKDGEYVTEVIGHEGTVKVATTFRDEKITAVKVLLHDETQGIGTYAIDGIPAKIVESQSINVDGISGATVTGNSIKSAVAEAVELAGGDISNYNAAPKEEKIIESEVEENVQVAIMGAGTAGLYAAAQLLEQGVTDVIIFEKQDIPGGSMPTTYGGMVFAGSEVYENYGLGSERYASWENMKASYESYFAATGQEYNPEFPFMKKMFEKSAELYDWMTSIGVGFMTLGTSGTPVPVFSPGVYEGGSGSTMEFLVKRIESKGGRIIYGTPVTDLIQDDTGRITGLVAEGNDGTTWTVNADSVILASGGFANNSDLIDEYYEEWSGIEFNTLESLTGDGLLLGLEYGAGLDDMNGYVPAFMSSYDSKFELAFMQDTVPGIMVNVNGDEFANIHALNHHVMSEAKLNSEHGDTFYYVFDEAAAALAYKSDVYGFDTYKAIFEKGEAVHYDSFEECADALDLPNLVDTINTNNELSEAGEANEWGLSNLPYIDENQGVWAIRVDPTPYLTTGGLKIDSDSHVLTEDGEIIPGLYAAGDVVGSVEEKDGSMYGYGFVAAMSFGAVAADSIAQEY